MSVRYFIDLKHVDTYKYYVKISNHDLDINLTVFDDLVEVKYVGYLLYKLNPQLLKKIRDKLYDDK